MAIIFAGECVFLKPNHSVCMQSISVMATLTDEQLPNLTDEQAGELHSQGRAAVTWALLRLAALACKAEKSDEEPKDAAG